MEQRAGGSERGYFVRGQFFAAPTLEPGLYVVATPIGNLSDISIRSLDTLAGADLIASEDTRVTRKLLARYGIRARTTSYHEHSNAEVHGRLLRMLGERKSIALVSDAGTPLISDPGDRLVFDAAAAGFRIVPIPGPSAAIAALSVAGLASREFLFVGFLPAKSAARRKHLQRLASSDATLVLFESPNRIAALLVDAAEVLGEGRRAVLSRELTKLHETIGRGSLADLAARYLERTVKGEIVLLIAPPSAAPQPREVDLDALLEEALRSSGVKEAAALVAEATGLSRRAMYQRALALKAAAGEES